MHESGKLIMIEMYFHKVQNVLLKAYDATGRLEFFDISFQIEHDKAAIQCFGCVDFDFNEIKVLDDSERIIYI
jgi:hypothetical protein